MTDNRKWLPKPKITMSEEAMEDTIDFPTANLGFMTTKSSTKVSASDYNSSRQPKIAIWPPKPEILISLEK